MPGASRGFRRRQHRVGRVSQVVPREAGTNHVRRNIPAIHADSGHRPPVPVEAPRLHFDRATDEQVAGELLGSPPEVLTQLRTVDRIKANVDARASVLQNGDRVAVRDSDDEPCEGRAGRFPPRRTGGEAECQGAGNHPPSCQQQRDPTFAVGERWVPLLVMAWQRVQTRPLGSHSPQSAPAAPMGSMDRLTHRG